jgi:hypothetical protein
MSTESESDEIKQLEAEFSEKVKINNIIKVDNEKPEDLIKNEREVEEQFERIRNDDIEYSKKRSEIDSEEIIRRERILMYRYITMYRIGKDPMGSTYDLNRNEKAKFNDTYYNILSLPIEQVEKEFNDLVNELIFNKTNDYSNFPVFRNTYDA